MLRETLDPESHGGAMLLGARHLVVISHGASRSKAITNSVALAAKAVDQGLVERIAAGLEA